MSSLSSRLPSGSAAARRRAERDRLLTSTGRPTRPPPNPRTDTDGISRTSASFSETPSERITRRASAENQATGTKRSASVTGVSDEGHGHTGAKNSMLNPMPSAWDQEILGSMLGCDRLLLGTFHTIPNFYHSTSQSYAGKDEFRNVSGKKWGRISRNNVVLVFSVSSVFNVLLKTTF